MKNKRGIPLGFVRKELNKLFTDEEVLRQSVSGLAEVLRGRLGDKVAWPPHALAAGGSNPVEARKNEVLRYMAVHFPYAAQPGRYEQPSKPSGRTTHDYRGRLIPVHQGDLLARGRRALEIKTDMVLARAAGWYRSLVPTVVYPELEDNRQLLSSHFEDQGEQAPPRPQAIGWTGSTGQFIPGEIPSY